MSKFTDARGRDWVIVVTVGTIKKVREHLSLDLADLSQATMDRLATDPCLLVDTLWLIVEADATQRKVSQEGFAEGLVGDPIDLAVSALLGALVDFFPERRRCLLRETMKAMDEARTTGEKMVMDKLADPQLKERLTKLMESRMDAEIEKALTQLNSPTS